MKNHLLFSALAAFLFLGGAIAQNGASLNFDGSNDQANLGSAITNSLAGGTKVSVEAWVKPSTLSGLGCIVGNYSTGAADLQILLRRSGNSYYEFWVGNSGMWYATNSVATPMLNTWQHIAATWDGTVSSIYVNGVLSGTTSPAMSTLGNAGPVWVGSNTINENFAGDIDEVRIWNSVRTQAQIQASMDCQVPPATLGLVASYNFNEGASGANNTGITSVNDVSGNGNTAALNGFALTGSGSNFKNDIRTDYLSLQSTIGSTAIADRLGNGYAIDYNNDGWKDVLTTADNSEIRLYLNNGHGNFSNYTVAHSAGSGTIRAMGDMDNDGDQDYVITKPGVVTAYINNGNGTFTTYPTNIMNGTGEMVSAKIADINGDSKADLILGNNNTGTTNKNEIWVNSGTTGSPSFTFLTDFTNAIYQTAIATGDVDEDGDVDILYGSYSNGGTLYLNNSNNGTFSAGTAPVGYSGGAELIDWNKDGHLDFINYEMYNRSLMVRYGYGNGTFSAISILLTNSVINMGRLIDINNDGFLDFVASNWGGNGLVYINNGCSFTLQNSCNYNLGRADNTVTLADFNNDGTPDIFCQARDNKSSFYLNFLSTVTTPPLSNILSAPGVTACNGSNAVLSATANYSGTIEWFNTATGGSPVSTNTNYTVSASTGTYTYYAGAVNANGCHSAIRKAVILTVNPRPTISVNSGSICSGQSFTMSPGGASTYTFSSGTSVVSPTSNATYNVTGTSSLGCISSNTAISAVTVNALPSIAANVTNVLCNGGTGSATVIATGGTSPYSYLASNGATVSAQSGLMPGSYTYTVTDANSCVKTQSFVVTEPSAIVTTGAVANVLCNGGTGSVTVTATGGTSPYSYLASNGATVSAQSGLMLGSYTYTVTDANSCVKTQSFVVTEPGAISLSTSASNPTICAGASSTLSANATGGTGTITYTWAAGPTTNVNTVTPTSTNVYTVDVTDANNCAATSTVEVTVNALPTVLAVTNNTLLCTGETATLSVSGGASTYTWSTTDNTTEIAVSPTVQTTYTVEGTDVNGCVNSTTITQDVSLCTGIVTLSSNTSYINVYPNPNNGLFVLELTSVSKVTVTDALGQVAVAETFEAGKHSLDIHNKANGVYFVKVIENNKQQMIKVIKQ